MKPALLLIAAACAITASSQTPHALIGDWRGDSVCLVRDSACHDEKALYLIKEIVGQPDRFSLQADKIVNGQPVNMGTVDCAYAKEKHTLTCEFAKGVLHLTLRGNQLEGAMNLSDGTPWRKINLRKDGAHAVKIPRSSTGDFELLN